MREKPETKANSAAAVGSQAQWLVVDVTPLAGLRLNVRFVDGTRGEVDLSRLVRSDDAGVFATLDDPKIFARVAIEDGAVTWPGEIDLAPDAMYDAIRAHGVWVPE